MTTQKLSFLHLGDLFDIFVDPTFNIKWIHVYSGNTSRRPEARCWSELDDQLQDKITARLHQLQKQHGQLCHLPETDFDI